MTYSRWTTTALGIGFASALLPLQAVALDIGGSNGISVNGTGGGLNVSVGGANGVNATVGGASNLANVSVGGASGVNANVGGNSSGGLGVNASVGGSGGINSATSLGGTNANGGLGVGTTASIGGTDGVNADVDATVGGSSLATASALANVGAGDNTLLDLTVRIPPTTVDLANGSVGGADGVNAAIGSTDSNGLGVDLSIGGASGVNSSTSIGGASGSGGLDVGTTASTGGTDGVNADVDATIGGSDLATANAIANVGAGDNTLAEISVGIPSVAGIGGITPTNPGDTGPAATSPNPNAGIPASDRTRSLTMINDMSAGDRAKAKTRCKDVVRSGGFDASLVSLCKMVIALR
jgi:hypothetical protein